MMTVEDAIEMIDGMGYRMTTIKVERIPQGDKTYRFQYHVKTETGQTWDGAWANPKIIGDDLPFIVSLLSKMIA